MFVSIIYFRRIFLRKTIAHFVLMFSMFQCLFIAFLVFGNEKLYVKEKGTMSTQIGLEELKSDLLLRLSDLLIWLLILAFLKTFSTNRFNRSCAGFLIFFKFVTYCFYSQNLIERNAFFKRIRICGFCVQTFLTVSYFVIRVWSVVFYLCLYRLEYPPIIFCAWKT